MYRFDFFWRAAARYPERVAVRLPGASVTAEELIRFVHPHAASQ